MKNKKIKTKFGVISVERNLWRCHKRDGKVRVYDSNGYYMTYFETERLYDCAKEMHISGRREWLNRQRAFKEATDIAELCQMLVLASVVVKRDDILSLRNCFPANDEDANAAFTDKETAYQYLVETSMLNQIGDYIVYIIEE